MAKETTRGKTSRTKRKIIQETARIIEPVKEKKAETDEMVKIAAAKLGLKKEDIFSYRVEGNTVTFITVNARRLKYTME